MRFIKFVIAGSAAILPLISYAQTAPKTFKELVGIILVYVGQAITLIFGLTLVVFIWGLLKAWVLHGGDMNEVERGRAIALWGIIGLTVMAAVWGIVALLRSSFFGI